MTQPSTPPAPCAPPVGGFTEVAGHRLFTHRAGSGPTVVFLPGASAVGLDYFGVQQTVSRFATAVVYDRGGTGFSDPLDLPRSATAVATELRALLRALAVPEPYVLVPHSLGGFYAHRFAQLYPADVAGLVWLDGLHRDWDDFMPPAMRLAAAERMGTDLAELDQLRPALRAQRAELLTDYPADIRQALLAAKDTDEWTRVGIAERANLRELAAELRAGPGLPDVPLIALSALGPDPTQPADALAAMHAGRTGMDAALVRTVTRGEHRILTDTVHHRLCFDRPDAVVAAVRDVLALTARA